MLHQPQLAVPGYDELIIIILCLMHPHRARLYDLDKVPGPWQQSLPVVGNVLECLRPDFHHVILDWADRYGGIFRAKFLWQDALVVTDPAALAAIMGRGEGAMDKAALVYAPINKMCDPHANANLLTSAADDNWKAVRKAVAVSFSMQVRGGVQHRCAGTVLHGRACVISCRRSRLLRIIAAVTVGTASHPHRT